jgi:hypothetical protein
MQVSPQVGDQPRDLIWFSYQALTSSFEALVAAMVETLAGAPVDNNGPVMSCID